jgi:hypothetical protein
MRSLPMMVSKVFGAKSQTNVPGTLSRVLIAGLAVLLTGIIHADESQSAFDDTWMRKTGYSPHGEPAYDPNMTAAAIARAEVFDAADDPAIQCVPFGLVRQSMAVYPMEIIHDENVLFFRYEVWDAIRMVFMDGREFPEDAKHTSFGYSIGHIEDESTLVIETRFVTADIIDETPNGNFGLTHTDKLRTIERYSLSDGKREMKLEMKMYDEDTFIEPWVLTQAWIRTPDEILLPYGCYTTSGEF